MNGAESLVRSLLASGVDTCFANPGTSELHFVAAIDRVGAMRPVLCMFEGVASGAADGYARMTGKPAATLLHLGPGLANAVANLHNAKKALMPVVNLIGEHATYHRHLNAPLTADIEGIARPVSAWVRTSQSALTVGRDGADAVSAARAMMGVATLIVPADVGWNEGGAVASPVPPAPPRQVDKARIIAAARLLKAARNPAVLLSGQALKRAPLELAGRIAVATGARLYCDFFAPRLERGAGIVSVKRLAYFGEQVIEELTGTDLVVLVETDAPVAFFAYPGQPSELTPPGTQVVALAQRSEDGTTALAALAEALGARMEPQRQALQRPDLPRGILTVGSAGAVIAALLPENALVADEACTSCIAVVPLCQGCPPHDWLSQTGGSLGLGLPMATGAAIACPDRKTICLMGDGSAMYTLQALWTHARENLDIVTIVFCNRSYAILNFELMRLGAGNPGPIAHSMLDLTKPELDFVALARGMGVAACRVDSAEAFAAELKAALARKGPCLIALALS